ncbi:MAG: CBS domain-containing protein [Synergistales bacterium]|nr:CBS domain-containing protein [Synergistales bacterium]
MNTTASQLMMRDLTALAVDDLIIDAVRVFYTQRIGGVPVVRHNWILAGFISESDILHASVPTYLEVLAQSSFLDDSEGNLLDRLKMLGGRLVEEFMTSDPIYVHPQTSLMTVADLMLRKRIKRLPVVEDGHRLAGVIDRGAFCEFMMEAEVFNER